MIPDRERRRQRYARIGQVIEAICDCDCDAQTTGWEMLMAMGYLSGELIRRSSDPEHLLGRYVELLRRHVRGERQH